MSTTQKSVLITGCSAGGIGGALAEAFQAKGYHVFATVRNMSKLSKTLTSARNVTPLKLDVLSSESIRAAVDSVRQKTGGTLDILVNNSGGGLVLPSLDTSADEARKLFDLNYWAPIAMIQAFAPMLMQAKGCVVNNTSANAYVPMPFLGSYNASKAALAAHSETFRHELEPFGVRTVTLITCAVNTHSFDDYAGPKLPESSLYQPARDLWRRLTTGELQKGAISPQQYATQVLKEVEKGANGTVWAGTGARGNRLGVWLAPQWFMVSNTEVMPWGTEPNIESQDKLLQSIVPLSKAMAV